MPELVLSPLPAHRGSTGKPRFKTAYADTVELQRLLMNAARSPELKPVVLAALSRSYCELEECKRKLRMKPLPKAVDVSHLQRSKKKRDDTGIAPAQGA